MKGKQNSILKYVTTMFAVLFMTTIFSTIKVQAEPIPEKVSLKNLTVTAGNKFELRATLSPINADDDQLVWSIVKGKKVISFTEDDDRYGDDEVEFKAIKAGTAKVCCKIKGTNKKAYATITVKAAPKGTITRVGKKNRTVEVGDDFELKVKKSVDIKNKYLKWSISNQKVVTFDDGNRYGNEVEFRAKKLGTATITCKNTRTQKKVKFKITVINDVDVTTMMTGINFL